MTVQAELFTIESWNHNAFEDKSYHMVWGPFPVSKWRTEEITANLKKFDENVKYLKYRHSDAKSEVKRKVFIKK